MSILFYPEDDSRSLFVGENTVMFTVSPKKNSLFNDYRCIPDRKLRILSANQLIHVKGVAPLKISLAGGLAGKLFGSQRSLNYEERVVSPAPSVRHHEGKNFLGATTKTTVTNIEAGTVNYFVDGKVRYRYAIFPGTPGPDNRSPATFAGVPGYSLTYYGEFAGFTREGIFFDGTTTYEADQEYKKGKLQGSHSLVFVAETSINHSSVAHGRTFFAPRPR